MSYGTGVPGARLPATSVCQLYGDRLSDRDYEVDVGNRARRRSSRIFIDLPGLHL